MTKQYEALYEQSIAHSETFWAKQAENIHWDKPWNQVLNDADAPFYQWFSGGALNICYNAIDRHVLAGRGEQDALIWNSPVTGKTAHYSYRQLQDRVAKIAGVLQGMGVIAGDRVIVYMPMVPEAAMAMLACARIGAIHSVVFGGFAAPELAKRIDDATPRVILSASCGIEPSGVIDYKTLLDQAIALASHRVEQCLILQREARPCALDTGRDQDWLSAENSATGVDCLPVDANHPLYILHTSGTTGRPKGIVRDHGGYAVALQWSVPNIYAVAPGEVMFTASDVGWVVGHSYIVYGPLINGSTTIMFEGKPIGTPDAGVFWRMVEQYSVRALFTAPTALRAIKKEDPDGKAIAAHDISTLRAFFLAGERSDPDSVRWAQQHLGVPVLDHWWQTETGWAIAGYPFGVEEIAVKIGAAGRPMPGYAVRALDDQGEDMPAGELGNIAIRLPLPPGTFTSLWGDRERHYSGYLAQYPGHYLTGDSGIVDGDGYVHIMSRIDDVINVAGHRLSTGGMEEVLSNHPDVVEAAVFGVADATKGQIPMGLVVARSHYTGSEADLVAELIQIVRDQIGPVAAFRQCAVVKRLPKTRSGKTLRGTMRSIANAEDWNMPATIDDPAILDEIADDLARLRAAR
ncbi:MAG: AMP-binding protein [Spiribacter sp.]|jgi:propionyl-CoA synthetase|nr:AMP-binding protein [Spiribacter sp.]MDR9489742.1 AMP-binding protein [Spiribacter sp.]